MYMFIKHLLNTLYVLSTKPKIVEEQKQFKLKPILKILPLITIGYVKNISFCSSYHSPQMKSVSFTVLSILGHDLKVITHSVS